MDNVVNFLKSQIKLCEEVGSMRREKRAYEMFLTVMEEERGISTTQELPSNESISENNLIIQPSTFIEVCRVIFN